MRKLLGNIRGPQGPQGIKGDTGAPGTTSWNGITDKPEIYTKEELARRIPGWQWKVTLPQPAHQTVTATVGGETYTETFYAPGGTSVAFSVKADPGYIAGTLSSAAAVLHADMTVRVTDATESEEIEAGSHTVTESSAPETVSVPPKVHVLKMTANGTSKFVRVAPNGALKFKTGPQVGESWIPVVDYQAPGSYFRGVPFRDIFGSYSITGGILIEWSKEINEHAADYDLTELK